MPDLPDLLDSANPSRRDHTLDHSAARNSAVPADDQRDRRAAIGSSPIDETPLLLFERVSKWYGPVIGLNQVTLELRSGITGLVGANGAGKSTLLRLATGQLRPDLGSVRLRGRDAWGASAKRSVGYLHDGESF